VTLDSDDIFNYHGFTRSRCRTGPLQTPKPTGLREYLQKVAFYGR